MPSNPTEALAFQCHDHHDCVLTLDRVYKYKLPETVERQVQAQALKQLTAIFVL